MGYRSPNSRMEIVKLKIFSMKPGNRAPDFDTLEADVNVWLGDHPDIVINHTNELTRPNMSWSHLALAVWYTER